MKESKFQSDLKEKLLSMFPGCIVIKTHPESAGVPQGIPDLLVLWKKHWALLECKASSKSAHRPNQDLYVDKLNKMSFSSFIYPENMEEVLNALERSFKRRTRR